MVKPFQLDDNEKLASSHWPKKAEFLYIKLRRLNLIEIY